MDRCALFVDAGHVLADGAMAVHGTRRRESVSWDYEGLLRLLASMATERSGLPLLRCYWYEATVEGRRSADHDTVADLPGVKLRLAKMRPGRREGVESEIHRDLEVLARNKAISDAVVVSAEEDLAPIVAEVQDLGMRVTLLHIAVDGTWTISRSLRQECDDITEISSEFLRPYVELIPGAEPPREDEREGAPLIALRPTANGHGQPPRTGAFSAVPPVGAAPVGAAPVGAPPPVGYPRAGERAMHEPPAWPEPPPAVSEPAPAGRDRVVPGSDVTPVTANLLGTPPDAAADVSPVTPDGPPPPVRQDQPSFQPAASVGPREQGRQDFAPQPDMRSVGPLSSEVAPASAGGREPGRHEGSSRPNLAALHELYAAPVAVPGPTEDQPIDVAADRPDRLDRSAARSRQMPDLSGYAPGAPRENQRENQTAEPARQQFPRESLPGDAGGALHAVPVAPGTAQVRRLPTRGLGPAANAPGAPSTPGQPPAGQPLTGGQPPTGVQPTLSAPTFVPPTGQPVPGQPPASVMPITPGPGYAPGRNGSYSGPQPVTPPGPPPGPAAPVSPAPPVGLAGPGGPAGPAGPGGGQPDGTGMHGLPSPLPPPGAPGQPSASSPVYTGSHASIGSGPAGPAGPLGPLSPVPYANGQPSVSLAEAVQSAHEEGQEFGNSVARDAPALWLEAVLARKPRMPSDLEARLLQGSSLPIDFLLHDEVRHALRRGFWDALERARR